jgi:hypothetical protein
VDITAARCRLCAKEFRVELGPEASSLGKYQLSEHLLNEHSPVEVALVYLGARKWYEVVAEAS